LLDGSPVTTPPTKAPPKMATNKRETITMNKDVHRPMSSPATLVVPPIVLVSAECLALVLRLVFAMVERRFCFCIKARRLMQLEVGILRLFLVSLNDVCVQV
jgi:hypothetical protein